MTAPESKRTRSRKSRPAKPAVDTAPAAKAPNARRAAATLLSSVLDHRRTLDEALTDLESRAGSLPPRDRAFAHAIAATALRRLGQIDHALGECLERPLPKEAGFARNLLRAGAAEILFMAVKPHAAVNEAVRTAGEVRSARRFKSLVNAVLRRIARDGESLLAGTDEAALNTPPWLWQSWRAAYGEPAARAIAAAHLAEAPIDLTLKERDTDARETWRARLGAERLPTGSLRLTPDKSVPELPGYDAGAWWVQDMAAALPAQLLGAAPGDRVLDLCAAPGGKTLQLAAAGADVTALDISANRLKRVRENLKRTGLTATLVEADATAWQADAPFGKILLDAPCSSTGTIRRHPDIPHIKSADDVAALAGLQKRLLDHALALLAPGGMLIYCTCSLEPEEGREQIEALLARNTAIRRNPISSQEVGGLDAIVTSDGDIRTLPCHLAERGGMDGFFITRLKKI